MGRPCSPVAKHIATLYKAMNLISSTEINFTPGNNLTDTDLKLVLSFIEATECSPHCIEFSSSKEHMHNRHQNNQQSNVLQEKKKKSTKPATSSSPWRLSQVQIVALNPNKNPTQVNLK